MTEQLVIAERFRGPSSSANGGYICGRLAAFIGNPAEVTLRARPPLGRSLDVHRDGDNLSLFDGDTLVAEGAPAEPTLEAPNSVAFEKAAEIATHCSDDIMECFVCGFGVQDGLWIAGGVLPTLEAPNSVAFEKAAEIATPLPPDDHPYPECFVCGPLRSPRDGLWIYPAELEGHDLVVAPWIPDDTSTADEADRCRGE